MQYGRGGYTPGGGKKKGLTASVGESDFDLPALRRKSRPSAERPPAEPPTPTASGTDPSRLSPQPVISVSQDTTEPLTRVEAEPEQASNKNAGADHTLPADLPQHAAHAETASDIAAGTATEEGRLASPVAAGTREKPVVKTPSITVTSPLGGISGRPLSDIINGKAPVESADEKTEEDRPVDPDAQSKIERYREKFLAKLSHERPRIGVVYETMEVEGNVVRVKVASKTLRDEVLRHRTETLQLLAAAAGVHGPVELEVAVDETMKAAKPIRIEDRIKYMADKNPEFTTLRRVLDMEIE